MKRFIQLFAIVASLGLVMVACEPIEIDEDLEMDDPMMEQEF